MMQQKGDFLTIQVGAGGGQALLECDAGGDAAAGQSLRAQL